MARKVLVTDNWVIEKRDGTLARFTTYSDASNAKRRNPTEYPTTSDIRFAKPE